MPNKSDFHHKLHSHKTGRHHIHGRHKPCELAQERRRIGENKIADEVRRGNPVQGRDDNDRNPDVNNNVDPDANRAVILAERQQLLDEEAVNRDALIRQPIEEARRMKKLEGVLGFGLVLLFLRLLASNRSYNVVQDETAFSGLNPVMPFSSMEPAKSWNERYIERQEIWNNINRRQ